MAKAEPSARLCRRESGGGARPLPPSALSAEQTQQRCRRPSSPSRSVGARLDPINAVAYA